MKFYSETLKKFYDSAEDCEKAEVAYQKELEAKRAAEQKKAETRKARAEEVEAAMKAAAEARAKYEKLLHEFCKDYGAFHYSYKDADQSLIDLITSIF